jgi:hypothetical protein
VSHGFARRLATRIMGSERMRMGGRYLRLTEEYKQKKICD